MCVRVCVCVHARLYVLLASAIKLIQLVNMVTESTEGGGGGLLIEVCILYIINSKFRCSYRLLVTNQVNTVHEIVASDIYLLSSLPNCIKHVLQSDKRRRCSNS